MPDRTQALNQLRNASMEMLEMMDVIIESVDGYRAKLEEHGYSPTAAEAMAMEFHGHLMMQMTQGLSGGSR